VGIGLCKANDVPDAIDKSKEDAKKMYTRSNSIRPTIPQEFVESLNQQMLIMKPAAPGTESLLSFCKSCS
jgi:ribosomal protein S5